LDIDAPESDHVEPASVSGEIRERWDSVTRDTNEGITAARGAPPGLQERAFDMITPVTAGSDAPSKGRAAPAGSAYAEAVIDLEAIAHNTRLLARCSGTAALMAVVKTNGFGHGALQVARTALAHGASWLGVTSTAEALQLRRAGIDGNILSWLHLPTEDFGPAIQAGIHLTVPSLAHLDGVVSSARDAGCRADVHLKIDTGLHRGGSSPSEWLALAEAARAYERRGVLRVTGIWSHLAHSDDPGHPTTAVQVRRFEAAVAQGREVGLRPDLLHLANSAAALAAPMTHFDMVRAGIALYGVEPMKTRHFGLRPAMTLRGRALTTRRVAGGEGVSYGHAYVTERETGLLLLPLGFADGIPRAAGPRGEVWVAGGRRPVAGRIAMDQCVINTGDAPVAIGEDVVVFGTGDKGEPTVAEWAEWAGTIPHEILTNIGARVPRRYLPPTSRSTGQAPAFAQNVSTCPSESALKGNSRD
jgi:alanine racemase